MPTVSVNLDTTQYVQVNTAFNPMVLQSLRDEVRITLSELKPTVGNAVFHTLSGKDAPLHFSSIDTNVWVLAKTPHSTLIVSETEPHPVAIHDGNGNPISSHYDALTDRYVINTHDADVHTRIFNRLVHQHTGTETTLSVASAVNDYQIQVTDTTGFIVGNALHINTGSVENTHPIITAITPGTPGVFTLDRRLDVAHDAGDTVEVSIIDLSSLAGTLASPQIYWAGPEPGEIWHLTQLTLAMGHGTAGDFGLFGNLTALANGVVLRAKVSGNYGSFTNWKTNGDINVDTGSVTFHTRSSGGGTHGTSADGPFKRRTNGIMRLDGDKGDRFELYVQDDVTLLAFWNMKVQGHYEG